jgi:hypothetical protein
MTVKLYTRNELATMSFGGLIRAIVRNENDCRDELTSLDGQGSVCSSESNLRQSIRDKYEPRTQQLMDEIDYRINHIQFR